MQVFQYINDQSVEQSARWSANCSCMWQLWMPMDSSYWNTIHFHYQGSQFAEWIKQAAQNANEELCSTYVLHWKRAEVGEIWPSSLSTVKTYVISQCWQKMLQWWSSTRKPKCYALGHVGSSQLAHVGTILLETYGLDKHDAHCGWIGLCSFSVDNSGLSRISAAYWAMWLIAASAIDGHGETMPPFKLHLPIINKLGMIGVQCLVSC